MMADRELEWAANDRLEDLLEAYATSRLAPAGPLLARIRANVVAQAATLATSGRPDVAAPGRRPRFILPRLRLPAPVFALGFAALLAAGTGAAVTAAPPGSMFYNTRLYLETALMPPIADIDARLAAYEVQFDDRVAEAQAALARGDHAGLSAALAAYQNEISAAVAELGTDVARLTRLESVLGKHIASLQELATKLPTQVARDNAIAHAVAASEKAVEKIKAAKAHQNSRPSVPPGQSSSPPNRP